MSSLSIEQALDLLAETPKRLAALTAGLTPAQLCASPESDEWSAGEVLAHLRSCADVWGGAIALILAQDEPTIRAISPRTYIRKTDFPQLQFAPSLKAFTKQRAELLATLQPLPPNAWARAAKVTGAGKLSHLTVLSYAERLALHERAHIGQVTRIAATFTKTQA
ncbi:hypothetical protein Rhe02_10020 [Rhizocola hellebori]|uniref:DinB-like domain-containing protein n=1 Tax=Rhizocola hellebori TaxID=1392758 RepID=A0A8J3VDQ7_9ACTN|nr:DinB family protein [Rhizocola hellebori]GIH02935.1 hypothetical protein Rhe02_10020 [Rhizocola hellebori]